MYLNQRKFRKDALSIFIAFLITKNTCKNDLNI